MKYALINNADNTLISLHDQPADWLPEHVAHKFGPEFETRFVPVEYEGEIEHDTATHYLRRLDPVLEDGKWRYKWEVVEKPLPAEVPTWALQEVCEDTTYNATNLKAAIDAAIENLPQPQKRKARNRWNRKPTIKRGDAIVAMLAAGLQLSDSTVDGLFRQAATLE